ncbi:MAG: hypothetical protein P4L59_20650 [Desulfosporosinus sp.]|nr:hypothetical protein [Desulfosporosinus sp.]
MNEKAIKLVLLGILLLSLGLGLHFLLRIPLEDHLPGKIVDSYRGVPVYYNGPDYTKDKGESFSPEGYYYGSKWQCVEYVKRFYYVANSIECPMYLAMLKTFLTPLCPKGD